MFSMAAKEAHCYLEGAGISTRIIENRADNKLRTDSVHQSGVSPIIQKQDDDEISKGWARRAARHQRHDRRASSQTGEEAHCSSTQAVGGQVSSW